MIVRADKLYNVARTLNDAGFDHAINTGFLHLYLRENYEFHKEPYRLENALILEAVADGLWMR